MEFKFKYNYPSKVSPEVVGSVLVVSIVGMFVGDCTVSDPDSVKVSYPEFISDLKSVGADFK